MRYNRNLGRNVNESAQALIDEEGYRTSPMTSEDNKKIADRVAFREAFLSVLSTTNSILTGRHVPVVASANSPIACTDGETVFINPTQLDKVRWNRSQRGQIAQVAHLIGVNYHEVSHIMWTPRATSKLLKDIGHISSGGWNPRRAWNLIEDQRIESLFAGMFRNAIPYFNRTIAELILSDPNAEPKIFHLWLHGRKYVPQDIRDLARTEFQVGYGVSDADLAEWDSIVDEYRTLVFPRNTTRGVEIVARWCELADKYRINGMTPTANKDDHSEQKSGSNSTTSEQDEAQDMREELEEMLEELDAEGDTEGEGSDDTEGEPQGTGSGDGNGEESDDSDSDADSKSESHDGTGDVDADSDSDSDDADSGSQNGDLDSSGSQGHENSHGNQGEGNSASRSDGTEGTNGEQKTPPLIERLQEVLAESSEKVFSESSRLLGQIRTKAEQISLDSVFRNVESPSFTLQPTAPYISAFNSINKALSQLRADSESSWEHGTRTGRLNINLMLQAELSDQDLPIFDQWNDNGDDTPDVEVVILLDQSSSMASGVPTQDANGIQSLMHEASASLWSIKKACQNNGIPCTAIGYSDKNQTSLLFRAEDKVSPAKMPMFQAKQSTDPSQALKIAYSVFQKSEAKFKILFSLSDGEWMGSSEEIGLVDAINQLGVHTVMVGLPCGYNTVAGNGGYVYAPRHSTSLTKQDGSNPHARTYRKYKADGSVELVPYSEGYNHKSVLLVGNSNDLAKQLGKVIISATANIRR